MTIEQLIADCKTQNRVAQRQLYEQYYSYSMSVCLRYAKDHQEAVAILNEAWLKIFQKLDLFDTTQVFKSWLRRVLINSSIDYHRKYSKNIFKVSEIDESTNNQQSTEFNVIETLKYDDILKLVQTLPPSYRTAFNLFVVEGYTHEDISEKLGITVGASKSNLFKAKTKLRELVMQQYPEYRPSVAQE